MIEYPVYIYDSMFENMRALSNEKELIAYAGIGAADFSMYLNKGILTPNNVYLKDYKVSRIVKKDDPVPYHFGQFRFRKKWNT